MKYVFLDAYIGTVSCTGYSGTPPYGHLLITATFFGCLAKWPYISFAKKTLVNRVTAKFFWPIGDHINGVPLY